MALRINLPLYVLALGAFVFMLTKMMTTPYLSIFLDQEIHLPVFYIGIIFSLAIFSSTIGGYVCGQISDILGYEKSITISVLASIIVLYNFYLASFGISFWLFTVMIYIIIFIIALGFIDEKIKFSKSAKIFFGCILILPLILLGYTFLFKVSQQTIFIINFSILNFLLGFVSVMFFPSTQGVIKGILPAKYHDFYIHLRFALINAAAMLAPLIVVYYNINASKYAYLIAASILGVYIFPLLYMFILTPRRSYKASTSIMSLKHINRILLGDIRLRWLSMIGLLDNFSLALLSVPLPLLFTHGYVNGIALYSILLIVNPMITLISQPFVYRMTKVASYTRILMGGELLNGFGILLFAIPLYTPWNYYLGWTLFSISESMIFPVGTSYLNSIAPNHLSGSYFGTVYLRQLGGVLAPLVGAILYQTGYIPEIFILVFIISLICCGMYFRLEKLEKQVPLINGR